MPARIWSNLTFLYSKGFFKNLGDVNFNFKPSVFVNCCQADKTERFTDLCRKLISKLTWLRQPDNSRATFTAR